MAENRGDEMISCDICKKMAIDELSDGYRAAGIINLCSDHSYKIYSFESKLVSINQKRSSADRFNKQELVKAKVICIKYGLNITVTEEKPKTIIQKILEWLK